MSLNAPGNHGGFQEICRAPADFCYTIPDGLDSAAAAPLLCAGITVYAPLRWGGGLAGRQKRPCPVLVMALRLWGPACVLASSWIGAPLRCVGEQRLGLIWCRYLEMVLSLVFSV